MSRRSLGLGVILLSLWASALGAATLEELLAYETGKPLDVKTVEAKVAAQATPGVSVSDVTFASVTGGEPTQAYVVRPDGGSGPFAGVLFVHWFAPPDPTSNRTQYLEEAKALARRGTVSLLVSTWWSDPARYQARKWEDDFQRSVNQGKELRRALDVLLAQPGVDPKRIAIVGHDYGAMFASLAAAADPRPKALVFIAGTARFADWYLFGSASGLPKGEALETFRTQLSAIDPVATVAKMKTPIFFQFGEKDHYTPRDNFLEIYKAAAGPKRLATYPAAHEMRDAIIRVDRTLWLAEQLGLSTKGILPE